MSEGLIRADQVKIEKVRWLWRRRIPVGMITVIAGRPDQGKGLFAAHIASEATKHTNVLYSAHEDSHAHMTAPRLKAAGARMDRVMLWRFILPAQMKELEQVVITKRIGLIVIDPLSAHLGSGVSRHSDNIRTVLGPLTALIEKTGTAVVIIEHALKRVPMNGHIMNAIGGSGSGLPAAARAAFVFGQDPSDSDRRILAPAKFNLGEKPHSLAFETDTTDVEEFGECAYLVFDDEIAGFEPLSLFAGPAKGSVGRPPDKRAQACEWLTQYLIDAGGPVLGSKVIEDAKHVSMATKTLRRAAEDMCIVKVPPTGGRNVTWDLPEDVKKKMGVGQPMQAPPAFDPDLSPDGEVGGIEELPVEELLTDGEGQALSQADIDRLLGRGDDAEA